MKKNAKDYVSAAQQFFTAYDAHDVGNARKSVESRDPYVTHSTTPSSV